MARSFHVTPLGKLASSICNPTPLDRATILTFGSLGGKILTDLWAPSKLTLIGRSPLS